MLTMRLMQIVRRRWPIVLAGLLITGFLVFATTRFVAPKHSVTATVLILPPAQTATGATNPYLQLGGLTSPVDVLARALNDPNVHSRVITSKRDGDYAAERDLTTSAPVMLITVEAQALAEARTTRDRLLQLTPEVLANLQTSINVPKASQLTSEVLSPEGKPAQRSKQVIRAALVVAAGGLALTLVLAGAIDSLLGRRQGAKRSRGAHRVGQNLDDTDAA